MDYRQRPAPADLSAGIECLWSLGAGSEPSPVGPQPVYPDGCVELVVHLSGPFRDWSTGTPTRQPGAFVVGPSARPFLIEAPARVDTVGVRFRPGAAERHLAMPLCDLSGRVVPLADLFGADANRLEESLHAAGGRAERFDRLVQFLRARRAPDRRPPWLDPAIASLLATRGTARIEPLARAAGLSRRSLERGFREHVGHSPKSLARIVRFQATLRRLEVADPPAWVDLALAGGYADQSHLIRDFHDLTGMSPGAHQGDAGRLARLFTSADRLEEYFRTGVTPPLSHSSKTPTPVGL